MKMCKIYACLQSVTKVCNVLLNVVENVTEILTDFAIKDQQGVYLCTEMFFMVFIILEVVDPNEPYKRIP